MEITTCLYCAKSDGGFRSVEHVLPESLGNKELILPKGVVCDRCNNGVLAQLDNYLLEFEHIQFLRVYLRIPNKAGHYPEAKFGNMKMRVTGTGIHVDIDKLTEKHYSPGIIQPDGTVKFTLRMRGKKDTVASRKRIARALYKMGLGALYLYDAEFARSSRFDETRRIILGKQDFSGYFIFRSNLPKKEGHIKHQRVPSPAGDDIVIFQIDLYGAEFIFDMEKRTIVGEKGALPSNMHVFEW